MAWRKQVNGVKFQTETLPFHSIDRRYRGDVVAGAQVARGLCEPVKLDQFAPCVALIEASTVNAGEILQRLAGVKVQREREQEGFRYRGPSCSRIIPEEQRPTGSLGSCSTWELVSVSDFLRRWGYTGSNSAPCFSMANMMTASLRASATRALRIVDRRAISSAQFLSARLQR